MSLFCATALLEPRLSSHQPMEGSDSLPSTSDRSNPPPPISFYPPLYSTPIQQRPPPPSSSSPSSFSSSPYVLNHKRRSPSTLEIRDCEGVVASGENSLGSPGEGSTIQAAHSRGSAVVDGGVGAHDKFNKASLTFTEHADDDSVRDHSDGKNHASCQTGDEFYDAPEGLPDGYSTNEESDSKMETVKVMKAGYPSLPDEVARRIRSEEALASLQLKYNEMTKLYLQFRHSGLVDSNVPIKEAEMDIDLSGFLSQKLVVARVVAASVASAAVRAEKDKEFLSILEMKNKEISRLQDKLQYYELVNREMSQRNQEIIETTQRRKSRHQKRQKFILGCLAAALCAGTAGLILYKLLPLEQATSSTDVYDFRFFSSESRK